MPALGGMETKTLQLKELRTVRYPVVAAFKKLDEEEERTRRLLSQMLTLGMGATTKSRLEINRLRIRG